MSKEYQLAMIEKKLIDYQKRLVSLEKKSHSPREFVVCSNCKEKIKELNDGQD